VKCVVLFQTIDPLENVFRVLAVNGTILLSLISADLEDWLSVLNFAAVD
jgi:hypothetical protein